MQKATSVVTSRVPPSTRTLAELAADLREESLSSFTRRAIEREAEGEILRHDEPVERTESEEQ